MLRIPFTAPGFAEGNLRQVVRVITGDTRSATFVVKSLAASATLAMIGTRVLSGHWPAAPKKKEDVRDLFKINTGIKDGRGNEVYLDTLTYDKDFWTVFGNLAILHPQDIPGAARSRLGGMESPLMNNLTNIATFIRSGAVYDYKGDPIIKREDPFARQLKEGAKVIGTSLVPIGSSTYQQFRQKGLGGPTSVGLAVAGGRPISSEDVRRAQQAYFEKKRAAEVTRQEGKKAGTIRPRRR